MLFSFVSFIVYYRLYTLNIILSEVKRHYNNNLPTIKNMYIQHCFSIQVFLTYIELNVFYTPCKTEPIPTIPSTSITGIDDCI